MTDYKPQVPTRADIAKISEEILPSIERDWGKPLDDRLRAVLKHHMTAIMVEVRNKVLAEKESVLNEQRIAINDQRIT